MFHSTSVYLENMNYKLPINVVGLKPGGVLYSVYIITIKIIIIHLIELNLWLTAPKGATPVN